MLLDGILIDAHRERTVHDGASTLLQCAWCADPLDWRAAQAAARGNFTLAAAIAGGAWESLAKGELVAALRACRGEGSAQPPPPLGLAEAETLIAAGAVVAGIGRLTALHELGFGAATAALARHCYRFGDHRRVVALAETMPGHAQVALTGAKAALVERLDRNARDLLEPFLRGALPVADALDAGAFAVIGASLLAREGDEAALRRFAEALLQAPDAPNEMVPAVARVAWCADLGREAWERFDPNLGPWAAAARLELAILSGDADAASGLIGQVGALGAPSQAMLTLLTGGEQEAEEAERVFAEGRLVHVWRTHPHRWQPWIDALVGRVAAEVCVYDLGRGEVPDEQVLPDAVLDDGALVTLAKPSPPPSRGGGSGVWIDEPLCEGVGIGHDWPAEEQAALAAAIGGERRVADPAQAAVWVLSADAALARSREGRAMIVPAPPGDPFWAGPLPGLAWPAVRVVRSHPGKGWRGAGARIGELAVSLCNGGAP